MKSYEHSEDAVSDAQLALERRDRSARRRPYLKGFVFGLFLARRRGPRRAENLYQYSDWYDVKLLVLSLSLLLLSCLDAAMTMRLLSLSAVELNPIMNELINQGTRYFIWIKIAVTSLCIIVLVAHNRIRLFNLLRVDVVLIAAVFIYFGLVTYEFYL